MNFFSGAWSRELAFMQRDAIVAPYLSKFAGPTFRVRYIGSLKGFFTFGFVAAVVLGYVLVPVNPQAWRYALIITALPITMLLC